MSGQTRSRVIMNAVLEPNFASGPPESAFAEFARSLRWEEIPEDVRSAARLSILDAIGIALASNTYPFAERATAGIQSLAGAGDSPVIGQAQRLPLRDAVLLNGILIHGLDFDDTHVRSIVHASASAVPLVLGVGVATGASGREAITAYVAALETAGRIGGVANGGFQANGFHPTGHAGAFGAVIAAGRLKGLSHEALLDAQGIVLSTASGSMQFLDTGAWTKRFHPGWSGVGAITATALAESGFVGPRDIFEGRYGLYQTFLQSDRSQAIRDAVATLGTAWEMREVAIKPYPVCHYNHALIDAALALREQYGLAPDLIKSITLRVHADQMDVVCVPESAKRRPTSDYDAKFSAHFAVAAALARGRFTLEELDDDALGDPGILALCDRAAAEPDRDSEFPHYYSGEVQIRTRDGRVLSHREQHNRGSDVNPLSEDEVVAKFHANATRRVSADRALCIAELVQSLHAQPSIEPLVELLTAP